MSKYYCLIASLPDLTLEDGKLSYTVDNFRKEIYPELTASDRKLFDLFYLKFDNANLLKLLKNKEAELSSLGNYSAEELLLLISTAKEGEIKLKQFPSYLYRFLSDYYQSSVEDAFRPEDILATYYYDYAMRCNNKFVSEWFELNLNINNILAAYTARKYKIEIAPSIIGSTWVSEAIRTSNARDFGLSGELDYLETLQRIGEMEELLEREKRIDLLKWNWLDEATFFEYFTVERVFSFLLRLEMIGRWISLDKEKGNELFRKIIDSLKNEVRIPEEFR